MKTTGVNCETKFGLLFFLGHPTSQCLEVSREGFKSISCCDNDLGFFCLLHQPYEFSMRDCRCKAFLIRKKGLLRIAVTIISNDVVSMILRGGQKSIHVAI